VVCARAPTAGANMAQAAIAIAILRVPIIIVRLKSLS